VAERWRGRADIAWCPEHGLHGERAECFLCGKPVEQIPMVPADEAESLRSALVEISVALKGVVIDDKDLAHDVMPGEAIRMLLDRSNLPDSSKAGASGTKNSQGDQREPRLPPSKSLSPLSTPP
jgi:hypothetical protein